MCRYRAYTSLSPAAYDGTLMNVGRQGHSLFQAGSGWGAPSGVTLKHERTVRGPAQIGASDISTTHPSEI